MDGSTMPILMISVSYIYRVFRHNCCGYSCGCDNISTTRSPRWMVLLCLFS